MRHGESTANQQGIIVSKTENGLSGYGLSESGRKQIEQSVDERSNLHVFTQIISSDFKRARESAEIAHALLHLKQEIIYSENLRERFFGDFELMQNNCYQIVWDHDAVNSNHNQNNVESADAVMNRTSSLVLNLEKEFKRETFLLVSHGDALQILQAAFHKSPASEHRQLPHLDTAEIRELVLTTL
jgi:probable phosphoglycerate mutase